MIIDSNVTPASPKCRLFQPPGHFPTHTSHTLARRHMHVPSRLRPFWFPSRNKYMRCDAMQCGHVSKTYIVQKSTCSSLIFDQSRIMKDSCRLRIMPQIAKQQPRVATCTYQDVFRFRLRTWETAEFDHCSMYLFEDAIHPLGVVVW